MKKEILVGSTLLVALVLLGAGCTDNSDTSSNADNNATPPAETPKVDEQTPPTADVPAVAEPAPTPGENTPAPEITAPAPAASDITLVAAAESAGTVRFTWETAKTLDESNRFIIIRGKKENPEHDAKNFWERIFYTNKEYVWANQPAGTYHYRVCLTENKNNDVCTVYSNDVTVTVQ